MSTNGQKSPLAFLLGRFFGIFQDPFTRWVLAEPHTGHGWSPVWGERNTFSRKGYIPKHQPLPIKISCVLLWSLHADQVVDPVTTQQVVEIITGMGV